MWWAVAFSLWAPVLAGAQEKMKVAVIQTEPLGMVHNGSNSGIHVDLLQLVAKEAGIPMTVEVIPKNRIFYELKQGSIDAAVFFPNKEAEETTNSAGVIEEVQVVAIGRKTTPIDSYQDLGKVGLIGLMPQMNITPEFDQDASLKKNVVADYETMVRMLAGQRLDVVVGNRVVLLYQLDKAKALDQVKLPGFVFKSIPNELRISKSSPFAAKAAAIKAAVESCRAKKLFDPIYEKYLGEAWH
jgi:polar amino acid transport system substrate-binding protein